MDSFWWFLVAVALLALVLWHVSNKIHEIRDESEAAKLQLLLTLSETRAAARRSNDITKDVIEAAAKAAAGMNMDGEPAIPWDDMPERWRQEWRETAEVVLRAAAAVREERA